MSTEQLTRQRPERCTTHGVVHQANSAAAQRCAAAQQSALVVEAPDAAPILVTAADLQVLLGLYGSGAAILRNPETGTVFILALRPGTTVGGRKVLLRREDAVSYVREWGGDYEAAAAQVTAELRLEAAQAALALAA